MTRMLILHSLLMASTCEDDGGHKCTDSSSVDGTLVATAVRQPVTTDLVVRGNISAPDNATVYRVDVNGIEATSTSVNFRSWTATIPIGVLAADSVSGTATITATALTNCGDANDAGSASLIVGTSSVLVDSMPGIVVERITVVPVLPPSTTYLPASKPGSAIVTINSNPKAVGTLVALTATLGTLSASSVILAGDGATDAAAQVLFSATAPGTAVITASAMGKAGAGSITVVGAPTFAPDGMALKAGEHERVTVITSGTIVSCQATPAPGMAVTSGSTNLMTGTGGIDQTQDGFIDIDVSVDNNLAAATTTILSCRDPFGQTAMATFSAAP